MLKTLKFIIVTGLCAMTSGCFVAPVAGLALKPILSMAAPSSSNAKETPKGPISVDQLLASARGDAPEQANSPEAQAIAAALASDPKPASDKRPEAISVSELLRKAREGEQPQKTAFGSAGKAFTHLDLRLTDILTDGTKFLRLQIAINGWAGGDTPLHVSLGSGNGTVRAASMMMDMEGLRQLCARLGNRCTPEAAFLQPGLGAGWVRFSPSKENNNA